MTEMNPPFLGSTLPFSNCFTPLPSFLGFLVRSIPSYFFFKKGGIQTMLTRVLNYKRISVTQLISALSTVNFNAEGIS